MLQVEIVADVYPLDDVLIDLVIRAVKSSSRYWFKFFCLTDHAGHC